MVPDGYEEIIFSFKGGYNRRLGHKSADTQAFLGESFIVSAKCEGVYADSPEDLLMIGVKLVPGTLYQITGVPADVWQSQPVPLSALRNPALSRLEHDLYKAKDFRQAVNILNQKLPDSFFKRDHSLTTNAIHSLFDTNGNYPINGLVKQLDCHHRTLERQFKQRVGLRPKQLARILRFKQAFTILHSPAEPGLMELDLHDLGYFDQSHFIKDFKFFTGFPPRCFLQSDEFSTGISIQSLTGENCPST